MVVKGKKLTFKEYLQKVKSEFKGMTPRQKLEHFWEYYKWILGLLVALIALVCAIVSAVQSLNTTIRMAGALVNVEMTPDGFLLIQDDYGDRIGVQEDSEIITVHNMQFKDPYTTLDQTYALNIHESILGMVEGKSLDYILFDDVALPFFLDPEVLMDLREQFTTQELEDMGTSVIYLQMAETGEKIPVAINIADTAFYSQHILSKGPIYLGFISNTPRTEICRDFWLYLKGGQTEGMKTRLAGTVVDAELTEEGKTKLRQGFFAAQELALGDDRVELTSQSFVQSEGEEEAVADMVKANVQQSLQSGQLDYVIADQAALAQMSQKDFLDLGQILTPAELQALEGALVEHEGVPVAIDLAATGFAEYCQGKAYLAFNGATKRTEACQALWAFLNH